MCIIDRGEVELPSDIHGVARIPYDDNWKHSIVRELEAAGFELKTAGVAARSSRR